MSTYRGANIRLLKQPSQPDIKHLFELLLGHGCNAVSLNSIHFIPTGEVNGAATLTEVPLGRYPRSKLVYGDINQHGYGINETIDIERIFAYTEMAFDMGFEKVVLKPMVDPQWPHGWPGGWRGMVTIPESLLKRFLADYHKFLKPYALVAQELEADLCMGTEMWLLTKDHGADFWIEQANRLRANGFTRQLTYAANWGWHDNEQAEFMMLRPLWHSGLIDYIGIDSYYPFDTPELARENWPTEVVQWMLLSGGANRNIVLTEVGWPNTPEAAYDPFGETNPPGSYTTEVSSQMWRIFRELVAPNVYGYFAWEAGWGSSGVVNGPHNALGTGLERLVFGAKPWD